jgi:hypothetical protein
MASSDRAVRIAALADKLAPLAGKTRGMRIEAEQWNALIDVLSSVLEIDRAQDEDESGLLDQQYARVDHQHLGQVSAAWLDPDLQARTGNGGSSVSTRQALADMAQSVSSLRTEVARLTTLIQSQQATVDRSSADEIDRTRLLKTFDDRFAGVEDLRTLVNGVAQSQQTLQANVSTVLDLRKSLADASGNPIDVAGLVGKVNDLQSLKDSLVGIDGKPVRLRDLQLQIIKQGDAIAGAGAGNLDQRLAVLSSDLAAKASADAQGRVDGLRTDLTATQAANTASLNDKLTSGLAAARDATLAASAASVAAAEARLNAGLAAGIDTAKASLATDLQRNISDAVTGKLANLGDLVAAAADARTPGIMANVQSKVQAALDANLKTGLANAETRIGTRVDGLQNSLTAATQAIPGEVQAAVSDSTTALSTSLAASVAAQADKLRDTLSASLDDRIKAGVTAALGDVKGLVTASVADSLKDLDTRIQTAVTTTTRGLNDEIKSAVADQVAAADIKGQIATANDRVVTQLRGEIATSAAKVQADSTATINSAVTNLRTEVTRTIDTRISTRVTSPLVVGRG